MKSTSTSSQRAWVDWKGQWSVVSGPSGVGPSLLTTVERGVEAPLGPMTWDVVGAAESDSKCLFIISPHTVGK
jgi:hypothetical protein